MGKEIERKFLLTEGSSIPVPARSTLTEIKQGYILIGKDKHVRIRLTKNKAILGIKYTDKFIRDEFEYEIPIKDGKKLYDKCSMKLEKTRHSFIRGEEKYDIDSFPNNIIFVEVEFKTLKASKKWVKPSWIDKEITGVKQYSNIELAKKNLKY